MRIDRLSKIIICILVQLIIFQVCLVFALDASVEVEDTYGLGDIITIRYDFVSLNDIEIEYYLNILCPSIPEIPLLPTKIQLEENVLYKKEFDFFHVDHKTEPQICNLTMLAVPIGHDTIEPIRIEKSFEILTDKSFDFNILLNRKMFVKDETANIRLFTNVLDPKIEATLTLPDKTTQQITLPYSFQPTQIGTYTLEVTASKQGYKTQQIKEQFGVIEKEPEIKLLQICNNDGKCSGAENHQNCPKDCPKPKEKSAEEKPKTQFWLITLPILLIIAGIVYVYFEMHKKHIKGVFKKE